MQNFDDTHLREYNTLVVLDKESAGSPDEASEALREPGVPLLLC